ncbi:serine/threonine-protein kinase PknK [Corallococcus sp. AS-1-6]|uniref:serine/threonine-protein kinase n=1 Tax=Corallococcus sp. AS-1-6 TaxID=2874599 RepID=UPI001CC061A0|nr:serine/threonine-protein kinase [Corallococcus sp. AS-1-6]MBZ4370158.1 protein kinase [Corallococcus sp. AS-1-6]
MRTPITLPGSGIGERRSLIPGVVVTGRYRVESLLGEGGMGRIWLADDLQERRRVALKEMHVPTELSAAKVEELVLLFRHEFFAMKKLQHPSTLKVFDWGMTEAGNRFITMEVVGGKDLSTLVRDAPLDTRTLYRVLIQMAQVLAFIHSRLYVHCDIKASNVRITESGAVKLMDFGVMHQLGTPSPGKLKGTLEYLAPEWQRGASIDGRADLYSLGVMAWYLATRKLPFKRNSPAVLLADHLTRPPPRPSTLCPVDPQLEEIILLLMAKDPRERFQDAGELLEALCHASGEPVPEEPLSARASYLHVPEVVGREAELEGLMNGLAEADWGQSRAMLVGGPAGVGKTRLLQEFELQAKLAELPFGRGQCRAEGLSPLAPVAQALRCLVPHTPADLMERVKAPLARLLSPEVLEGDPDEQLPRDGSEEKAAFFEALTEWTRTLGGRQSFVLCFEDLQWADSVSLEALNGVIRALHGTRGMVVGTFRSQELSRLSLAFQTVDEKLTSRMDLEPLSAEHVAKLVELVLPGLDVPGGFVQRLHETTGGNAFFATECLRMLVEAGALKRVGGRWEAEDGLGTRPLPASIQEAVLMRLANAPPEQVALLRKLAPAGRMLDLPLLRALSGLPEAELFAVLDGIVERQFLQDVEGRYVFTHDTVHQAVYDSTPEAERRAHHGQVARALQALPSERQGVVRAVGWHFARSDAPAEAIQPLLQAGQAAIEAEALLEATLLLKEAAGLLESAPDFPGRSEQLLRTWVSLVEVGYSSDPPTSVAYAERLFAHWAATVDVEAGRREALSRLQSARAATPAEREELLIPLFREVSADGRMAPVDVFWKRSELQILQGMALAILGRTEELEALIARVAAEHPEDSPYRAGLSVARSTLCAYTGHWAGGVAEQRKQVQRLREFRDAVGRPPRRLAWALGMGGYLLNVNLALRGEPLDEELLRDGLHLAEGQGFTDVRAYHLFAQVARAAFTGDGAAFASALAQKTELVRRLGSPRLMERNLALFTPPYYLERGEHELVAAVVSRGEALSRVLPEDRWLRAHVLVYQACRDVLFEDAAAARESLPRALEAARMGGLRMETLVHVYQSRFERDQGRLAAALVAAEAALARALDPRFANPWDEILARRALAPLVSRAEGDAHLRHARLLAEATGNVLQMGLVYMQHAERHGTPEEAMRELEIAERAFATARATHLQQLAQSLRGPLSRQLEGDVKQSA